jgi:coenzyme F420-reducing hydrogenase gamma subunit
VKEFTSLVYAHPEYISTLARSTPIADHVFVDFELRGCPVNKYQLLEVISAFLAGRKPNTSPHSVCMECKRRGVVCVMVARGTPCLGPVTHAGCGALCPSYQRGCYGCFGPKETPNTGSLATWMSHILHTTNPDLVRAFRSYNAGAEAFQKESFVHEKNQDDQG